MVSLETRNLEIDRLRAIAVIMTVFCHLDMVVRGESPWYEHVIKYFNGQEGVILFFAISGFVISKTLIGELEKHPVKDALYSFWIKRLTRITPIALVWITLPLLGTRYLNDTHIFGDLHWNNLGALAAAFNVFNIYNLYDQGKSMYGVYWSLSLEEQFYLIFPFFLLLFRTWNQRMIALTKSIVLLSFLPFAVHTAFRAEAIIFGIMVYHIIQKIGTERKSYYEKEVMITAVLILLACINIFPVAISWMNQSIYMLITPIISAVLVWIAAQNKGYLFDIKWLSPVLDWIGTRSFGIYLIHVTSFNLAFVALHSSPVHNTPFFRGILSLVFLIGLTELSYRLIEVPIRRWGRNIANQRTEGKVNNQPKKRREIGVSA